MRKPTAYFFNSFILFVAVMMFLSSCKNADNVPFPIDESEFAQPVAKPLKFSEPKPIEWAITSSDSIKSLPVIHFDFNKLPSKPFDIGESYPLLKPLDEKKFDWNSLPDTAFNLEDLPSQKLKFKTSVLGSPKIVKAGIPAIRPGTSRGILEAGTSLGLPGIGRCFLQDKYGMIWIGTDKGLCRYDGENVETYSFEQGINDPNIFSIFEDEKEQIWIGTGNGDIYIINRKAGLLKQPANSIGRGTPFSFIKDDTGRIWVSKEGVNILILDLQKETIQQLNEKNGLLDNGAFNILKSSQGLIWVLNNTGVNVFDLKNGKNKRIKKINGLSSEFTFGIMEDDKNRIWLGGDDGADIIDIKAGTIKHLWTAQGIEHSKFFDGFFQDREGKYWIGTDTGTVYSFDERKNLLEKFKVNMGDFNDVLNFMEDSSGQIWMGALRGSSYIYNPNSGKPGNVTKADGLIDNEIWSTHKDKNGLIWIGTNSSGVDIYNPITKKIKHIGKEQGLIDGAATALMEDSKGRIWIGGGPGGINIVDIKKGTIQILSKAQGLTFNNCSSITEDRKGQIWICSRTGELQVINLQDKIFKTLKNSADYNSQPIYIMYEDHKGKMWIGSRNAGVVIADNEKNTITRLSTTQGLSSNEVYTIEEDGDSNIWIGTRKGIDVANLQNNTLTSFTVTEGLVNNEIWTLNEHDGSMYAGTTAGLSIITPKQKEDQHTKWEIRSIGKAQGLSFLDFASNSSSFINGQLWGGVEREILTIINAPEFDTTSPAPFITGINIMDKPQRFSDRSVTRDELKNTDTLWKTGTDSFYLTKQLPADSGYLKKNKIEWDSTDGPYLMPVNLQLPHNQNYLSFTFTGNQVSNPDKTRYRYILEGIDKNWSPISDRSFSENYRDLPSGDYTFKVSSKGMNGVWSKPATFDFTILPPWWKTWWAYIIYALLFLGALRVFSKWRERNLRREKEKLEFKVNHRTKQLQESIENLKSTQSQLIQSEKMASLGELTAGIAHEIQNPLNFVNNFSEVNSELITEMKEELTKGNIEEAKTIANDIDENEKKIIFHGRRADAIVKGMLQHSRSSSGQKEPTDINALADEYFRLAYHGLRAKDKTFNSTMISDFEPGLEKINVVTQEIGRVILNLITNAFYSVTEKKKMNIEAHTPDGQVYEPTVWVTTKKIGHKIEVIVKDNGLGVPQKVLDKIFQPFFTTKPVGQGTGLGLSLSYDIIKAHGGELKVETKENEGAAFIIQLPI